MYILAIKTSASDHNFTIGASQVISRALYLLRPMVTFYSYGSTTTGGAKLVQPQLPWHRLEAEWLPMAPATNTFTHIHNPMWVKCVARGQRLGEISNHQTSSYWTTLLPPWRAEEPQGLKQRRNYYWTAQHRKRKFADFGCTFSSGEPRRVNKIAFVLLESTLVWIIFFSLSEKLFSMKESLLFAVVVGCWSD